MQRRAICMYAKANTSGLGLKSLNNKEFIFKPDYIQEMRKTAIKHYLSTFIHIKEGNTLFQADALFSCGLQDVL